MNWLLLLKSLLSATASLTKWLGDKQLLDAGEAKQIVKALTKERGRVENAINVRNNIKFDTDSVRDDRNNRSR